MESGINALNNERRADYQMKKELLDENKCYPDLIDRTRQDRNEIRWLISAGIEKTLTDAGFMRQNTSYFRIHGDHLLQVISVTHRAYLIPRVEANICFLYAFSDDWVMLDQVGGCIGFEGETIETLAGLMIHPGDFNTYFDNTNVYGPGIKKEVEVLEKYTLPYLQEIRTVQDVFAFHCGEKAPTRGHWCIAPYLRIKEYEKAEGALTSWLKDPRCATSRDFYERRVKRSPHYRESDEEFFPRVKAENQRLLTAIQEKDEEFIYQRFNENIEYVYFLMKRYIPGFVKRHPMQRIAP